MKDVVYLTNCLFSQIFRCPNVKYLSLKYNGLESLPCDIGRMKSLEYLALTNNKLSVWSLPYSLTFLSRLHTLLLGKIIYIFWSYSKTVNSRYNIFLGTTEKKKCIKKNVISRVHFECKSTHLYVQSTCILYVE